MRWPWNRSRTETLELPRLPDCRLRLCEAPTDDASPDQWFDWLAAHATGRDDWAQAAANAYRQKWGGP